MNKFDTMGKDAINRMEEIMNSTRLNEFLHRKEEEDKKKNNILWILAIIKPDIKHITAKGMLLSAVSLFYVRGAERNMAAKGALPSRRVGGRDFPAQSYMDSGERSAGKADRSPRLPCLIARKT